ncbi:hypothetical protein M0R45_038127 [Rubus argutus]|uniref:WRKY domain-containing protein n=1 Tax=Rubus argutus TaxID=59490 RepID=A0AAW1W4D3_RUBAR
MADDDWDLYAVVRSCNSATNTATTTSNPIHHGGSSEEPSWMWDRVMKREELETNVGFPNLESRAGAFQGLEEFYQPFFPNPTIDNTTTTTNTSSYAAAGTIIPNSSTSFISDFGGGSSSSGQHQLQQQQNNFVPANTNTAITPHFNPGFTPVSGFGRFHEHQQLKQLETPDHPQELIADPRRKAAVPSVGPLMPTMQIPPQLIRPRKRKSQVKKVVCHLTADNLSSDLWAWRKYGQKPIKGSPHPRNYYRCSSSKGCSARKQVERSTEDSGMFVVTYAGEHTHPRPTHRNSLAGSTRNKPAATTQKAKDSESPASAQVLAAQGEDDEQTGNNNSVDGYKASEEAEDEEIEEEEDDEEFLVPNMRVAEDIFLGMKQLGRTASGGSALGSLAVGTSGDGFSTKSSNLGSSWGTNCSSSAGATVGGGC